MSMMEVKANGWVTDIKMAAKTKTTNNDVIPISSGLIFILNHFKEDNALWPKFAAVADQFRIPVTRIDKALALFYGSRLMDCRMCPFPDFVEDYRKSDVCDCMAIGGAGIVPNFLMIDLDKGRFSRTLNAYKEDALNDALFNTLARIDEKFHGRFKPTILWTGNGYHIYLPVQLSGPSWCLGHTDGFMELSKTPDRDFLRWAELYLSDGLADTAHYKTTSFKNMYCRIPGSFSSKNNEPVRIVQRWDGKKRPYINWILKDFHDYLVEEKKKPPKLRFGGGSNVNGKWEFSTKW
jgi:hypothetical protein